jgi:imidazole glycerol-phosphate synthase subunit HisH
MSKSKYLAIVDYGMGNLRSVQKALEKVHLQAEVTDSIATIENAHGVILPGVGSFIDCMKNLEKRKLVASIYKAIAGGKPFLGICLGLQVLFSESEEFGIHPGLDIFKGRVVRFSGNGTHGKSCPLKVPHMGWNSIAIRNRHPLLENISDGSFFYFVHSYYVKPEDPGIVMTTTIYGTEFVSSVARDNVFACQFHPEKSQKVGLQLLKQFGTLIT